MAVVVVEEERGEVQAEEPMVVVDSWTRWAAAVRPAAAAVGAGVAGAAAAAATAAGEGEGEEDLFRGGCLCQC